MYWLTGFTVLTGLTCLGFGSRSRVGMYSLVSSLLELAFKHTYTHVRGGSSGVKVLN